MYMSPEVIKNDKRGRPGAMDIWSLGCVVLEFATGKKPWSNLDNEWCVFHSHGVWNLWFIGGCIRRAVMFHIGVATQHPPLPEPGQLSELGIDFIKECLTIDPMERPSALELMNHAWMVEFREALMSYEEAENATRQATDISVESPQESSTAAKQAALLPEEVDPIKSASSSTSVLATPPADAHQPPSLPQ